MKNLLICLIVSSTLFSCTKSSVPPPPPPVEDSLLKSVTVYIPLTHSKGIMKFGYDDNSQIASLHLINYDTSSGSPEIDSNVIEFVQHDATTPPASYVLTYHGFGDPPAGEAEQHLLFYDGENRVVRDSIGATDLNSYTTMHFTYDTYGYTTIEWLAGDPQVPGSYTNYYQIDSMNVSQENMLTDMAYNSPGGVGFIHFSYRNFSAEINPLYNAAFANSLGCLLSFNSIVDFRSQNLPSLYSVQEDTSPAVALNFVYTKDAAGRVVQGIGTDNTSGLVGQIYTYTY